MKVKLITGCLLLASAVSLAQVQVSNGPNLANDKNSKMNRMLGGDDNSFYCYRVRSKGKGTSFIVEKYDKVSLKPVFSKEMNVEDEKKTKIEDVEYAKGNVFIFRRQYDKAADKMALIFQTVSSDGQIDPALKEVVTVSSDHFEFVDFDIYPNPSQTKFLIKACHKANKADTYKTDLILMDAVSMKKVWTKTLNQRLSADADNLWAAAFSSQKNKELDFAGIYLDETDNVFYAYSEKQLDANGKNAGYLFKMGILLAKDNQQTVVDLPFDDKYYVTDVQFMKANNGNVVLGGFLKDVIERTGKDDTKAGIFNFSINPQTKTITSKTVKFFDQTLMESMEAVKKSGKQKDFKYRMDYILPVGKDVYYVGQMYQRYSSGTFGGSGVGVAMSMMNNSKVEYTIQYMDYIVAKLNSNGQFEWITNAPFRTRLVQNTLPPPMYKQYFAYATNKGVYILNDENAKNMAIYSKPDFKPKMFKDFAGIHGSNFVSQMVSLTDGKLTRSLLFNNKTYCFAPIQEKNPQFRPPVDCEIFVPSKNNELFIYTENKGLDRFTKLKLE